jgi:hypothetical protein
MQTTKRVFAHLNLFAISDNLHSCFIPVPVVFLYTGNENHEKGTEDQKTARGKDAPALSSFRCSHLPVIGEYRNVASICRFVDLVKSKDPGRKINGRVLACTKILGLENVISRGFRVQ